MAQQPTVRLIAKHAWFRVRKRVELEDLVSVGTLGSIKAVDAFDELRGCKLQTLAEYYIRGAIGDYLRAIDWAARGDRARIKHGLSDPILFVSLNNCLSTCRGTHDPIFLWLEQQMDARALIDSLDDRERFVLEQALLGYGYIQIGKSLGVVPSRVSQIKSAAIERISREMQTFQQKPLERPSTE